MESLGEEGVGNIFICVAVGSGKGVKPTEGTEFRLREEQAVRITNPIAKIANMFFIRALEFHPILIRRRMAQVSARA
jgi:hypothetical protein